MNTVAARAYSREESLKDLGLDNLGHVCWNLPTAALYEEGIRRYEAASPGSRWLCEPANIPGVCHKIGFSYANPPAKRSPPQAVRPSGSIATPPLGRQDAITIRPWPPGFCWIQSRHPRRRRIWS